MGMREAPQVNVRLHDDVLRGRLYRYARRSGRTVQWIVSRALETFLERAEREDALMREELTCRT